MLVRCVREGSRHTHTDDDQHLAACFDVMHSSTLQHKISYGASKYSLYIARISFNKKRVLLPIFVMIKMITITSSIQLPAYGTAYKLCYGISELSWTLYRLRLP